MSDYWNSYQSAIDRVRPVISQNADQIPSSGKEQTALRMNMASGETIQGEILSVKGNEVMVRLSDQTVISAKLTGELQILVGQNLMFEVQNSSDGQVALRALFTNLAGGELLANALSDAGIPLNADTEEMVTQLVKEELPIGKEHLQEVYREVLEFRELKPAEIVKMHKLGMEVNEQNVKQFSAFINYEERIASDTAKLISSLKDEIVSLQFGGKTEQAFALEQQLLNVLTDAAEGAFADGQTMLPLEKAKVIQLLRDVLPDKSNVLADFADAAHIPLEEVKALVEEFVVQISKENSDSISSGELFTFLANETKTGHLPKEMIQQLFEKEAFRDLVGKALEEQWLLRPEEVETGKNVTEFYQRLQQHITTLSATLAEAVSASQTLTQSLTQMKENVDFLNQLSQMIPYVQLPLKLNGQSATGDLYVFADKKSLSEKGENITAALHLDMQYLGHMDVFVKMVSSKVETDFKVESDDVLQFLSEHIDVLNERLQKRGYDLKVNLDKMNEPSNIKKDLMGGALKEESEQQPIAYYRLDVRA